MKDKKAILLETMSKAIDLVDALSEEELNKIAKGLSRIVIRIDRINKEDVPPRQPKVRASAHSTSFDTETDAVAKSLQILQTREEGIKLLGDACPTKSKLSALARHLDLHVLKEDDSDVIRDKIIEATIGFRLRSSAVLGTSLQKP